MDYKLKEGKISLEEGGKEKAVITWEESTVEDNLIYVTHTIVHESLQGQGIAQELLERIVKHARDTGKKIVPVCKYAYKKFNQSDKYDDVYCKEINPDRYVADEYELGQESN